MDRFNAEKDFLQSNMLSVLQGSPIISHTPPMASDFSRSSGLFEPRADSAIKPVTSVIMSPGQ